MRSGTIGPEVVPASDDPVVRGLAEAVGGPPGVHARTGSGRWATPTRVVVLLVLLTSVLGFVQKLPCRDGAWTDGEQYTRACYTDVLALYYAEQLGTVADLDGDGVLEDTGRRPYLEYPVEYPVGIGAVMAVVAKAVALDTPQTTGEADRRATLFVDLTWALMTACALVVALAVLRLAGPRRPWDAAMVAVAPALALHVVTNWDLVAVAFATTGLLAWARQQPVLAGVLLGLGTATKLYPVLFLVPLLALAWRATGDRRRLGSALVTSAATLLTAAAVTVPVYLASPAFAVVDGQQTRVADSPLDRLGSEGLAALAPHTAGGVNATWRFVELNSVRPADWDSLWYALQTVTGSPLDGASLPGQAPSLLNGLSLLAFAVALVGVVLLALRAPRAPRLASLLFLTVVAFLLTNKVFSPQYVLWLVPLAVLARPRWGPFLAWQATEVALLLARFWFFHGNDAPGQGLDAPWFVGAVLLRDAALLVLSAAVVRDILRPDRDLVRTTYDGDDPARGSLPAASPPARVPLLGGDEADRADRRALGVWGGSRALVLLGSVTGAAVLGGSVTTWLARWDRWDVGLFRKVAELGYQGYPERYPDVGIEAFFPGLPGLLRVVHLVVPDWTVAGLLVSLVAGAVAAVWLSRLAALDGVPGHTAVMALVLSPYAVFLAAGYSEALFLALALPGWWAARQQRWATASLLVAGACTVRVSGLFLAVALVVHYALVERRVRPSAAWLAAPWLALSAYAGWLWAATGDPLRWLSAQEQGWDRRLTWPWEALATSLGEAADTGLGADYLWSWRAEVLAVAVGVAVTVVLVRRGRFPEATYVGLSVGALATSTYYLSVARATLLWFPLWLLLGEALARRTWLRRAYVAVSAPLMVVLVLVFTSGRWVG